MKDKPLSRALFSLLIFGTIISLVVVWLYTGDLSQAGKVTLLYICLLISAALIATTFNRLSTQATDQFLRLLDKIIGLKKEYFKYLYYRNRDFHTRGLSLRGEFNLDLELAYVDLTLSTNMSRDNTEKTIWEYLQNKDKKQGKTLVIIGWPGSGKTTLLKMVTVTMTKGPKLSGKQITRKVPILLSFRENGAKIIENPQISLPEIIVGSLTRMNKVIPSEWFKRQLRRGNCVVMLDGLDEIGNKGDRPKIMTWLQDQIYAYPANDFIVTSRPHGYDEAYLSKAEISTIKPFDRSQSNEFISKWYYANEYIRNNRVDDFGVRINSQEKADELVRRLDVKKALSNLATNPLLITMIATVHSFKGVLPGRRVELYRDIFSVLLERRIEVWQDAQISPAQILEILKLLAYRMMTLRVVELESQKIVELINDELSATGCKTNGNDFLKKVGDQSGLVIESDVSIYRFAHKSFQEYLASAYILDDRSEDREKILIESISDDWWHETILLYAAQTDCTNIVGACLQNETAGHLALTLAIECVQEALKLRPSVRASLQERLDNSLQGENTTNRKVAAEAMLSSRLRWMSRLGEGIYIDDNLITNVEYQLFIDEMIAKTKFRIPDSWRQNTYEDGKGTEPVFGVRSTDAVHFCEWLTSRDLWMQQLKLPDQEESKSPAICITSPYWIESSAGKIIQSKQESLIIRPENIRQLLEDDLNIYLQLYYGLDRSRMPRLTSEELLARNPIVPLHSHMAGKSVGVRGREILIQKELETIINSSALFARCKKCALMLQLDIERFIDQSALLLENVKNPQKPLDWYGNRIVELDVLDIDDTCQSIEEVLNDISPKHLPSILVEQLLRAVRLLKSREWVSHEYDSPSRGEVYKFLRWLIRIGVEIIAFRVNLVSPGGSAQSKKSIEVLREIYANLLVLENKVNTQSSDGCIRLVKVDRSYKSG